MRQELQESDTRIYLLPGLQESDTYLVFSTIFKLQHYPCATKYLSILQLILS